jgi:ubiquinone/menaquinone biosynthesis C-methylase UbiE
LFNLNFLEQLRLWEMDRLIELVPRGSRVLEFGAGTGEQAKILANHGFEVFAIDLASSSYSDHRVFPVVDYDGARLPLDDHSVDVIFSSNVLEHVENLPAVLNEFRRILKPGGFGIHVMPTPSWRFWTFVAGIPTAAVATWRTARHLITPPGNASRSQAFKQNARQIAGAVLPIGHGVSKEGISELWTFSPRAWKKRFGKNGHVVVEDAPMRLFYTGHMALGSRLSAASRERLSYLLGSATRIYVVKPAEVR